VHSERRRGKSRSRILYCFRTPPGVRVGRAALDDDAIRQIEELNPSIEFDWPRILKGQGDPKTTRDGRQADQSPERPQEREKRDEPKPEPRREERQAENDARGEPVVGQEPVEPEREIPAHARLGAEGVARLRSRYAEVLSRLSERVTDPVQREELKVRAERLNPDSWVTDQEVVQGLEAYESTLAALQSVVGRKRRRRRRGRRPADPSTGSTPQDAANVGDDVGDEELSELNGTEDDGGDAALPSQVLSEEAPEKPEEL
jgi:hypothetical protein